MMSSSSTSKVLATPTRDRLPFPQSLHPSPNNQRTPSVSTTGSSPVQSLVPSQSITVESLLSAHASTPSPPLAALEVAVSERNLLSAQNSQLWKLIEKQRSGYNQILKELERVRGERDGYRAKLQQSSSVSQAAPSSSRKENDRTKQSSLPVSTSTGGSPPSESGTSSTNEYSQSRNSMNRHYSDDQQTPRAMHHTVQSSRSLEPLHTREREALSLGTSGHSSSPLSPPSASTPIPSLSQHSSKSSLSISAQDQKVTRITIPSKTESFSPSSAHSVSSSPARRQTNSSPTSDHGDNSSKDDSDTSGQPSNTPSASVRPLMVMRKSSLAEPNSGTTSNHVLSIDTTTPQTTTSENLFFSPQARFQSSISQSPSQLAPVAEDRSNRILSRESRISLPDEAKQYIVSMTESPLASPQVVQNSEQKDPGVQVNILSYGINEVQSPGPTKLQDATQRSNDSKSRSGAKEQGTNGSSSHHRPLPPLGQSQENKNTQSAVSDVGLERPPPRRSLPDPLAQRGSTDTRIGPTQLSGNGNGEEKMLQHPTQGAQQAAVARAKAKSRAAVDDFPLPPSGSPSYSSAHPPLQTTGSSESQPQHQSPNQHQTRAPPPSSESQQALHASTSLAPVYPSMGQFPGSEQDISQYFDQPQTVPASFRALPLLPNDLPHTRIQVSHSSVRPNDRGKDVLSFTIVVDPTQGKEPWRVEKLYSDVLGLDSRIRAGVGKGVGKKIGNLPEGKLWKDHAPSKVDQRKVALETYLQTLINLPVKNKDEVIAFFTSDIVREAKLPVSQIGYKEGYLTKRGKNFGGWKTRYFVLQGPVLEYYESRGGTHLGSIVITGAQIGRQQRSGDKAQGDEEKEYRHAFLIVEAKKGPGGNHPRHVLCAESDQDRDSWVEMLVRYVMGAYSEEPLVSFTNTSYQNGIPAARSSTSSLQQQDHSPSGRRPIGRGQPKDELKALTTSTQGPQETSNQKSRQGADDFRSPSPMKPDPSPVERLNPNEQSEAHDAWKLQERVLPERLQAHASSLPDPSPLSSSLPTISPLEAASSALVLPAGMRSNSELGHYPDLQDQRQHRRQTRQLSPEKRRAREPQSERKPLHRDVNAVRPSPTHERESSPEKSPDGNSKVKISGPINGAPIPAGYKFGSTPEPSTAAANDRREKAKSRLFWGFGRPAGSEKPPESIPRPVFGVQLDEALEVSQICNLPTVVFRCIQYLEEKKSEQEEGIYRLSGSSAVIKNLKDRFNAEGDVDLLGTDEYWDPHAIAGLLKSFLRELPASILTRELHLKFLAVIDFVDPQERIRELSQLISSLPIANYSLLRALTAHLILIVQNSATNKMTMRNVGIVFSPTLGIPAGVFSLMLGEFNRVFNVDSDDNTKAEGEAPLGENSGLNRRNSQQYSDAAADQILGLSGRKLTTPVEEPPSDGDDFSVTEESGAETTEGDVLTLNSSNGSSPGSHPDLPQFTINEPTDPSTPRSKASAVAANRGLNIAVSGRGNRHSRILGLPTSPRPQQTQIPGQQSSPAPNR